MERKFITYFEEQGNDYTDDLIKAVKDKLESSGDIKRILIASSTGESALKLYAALDDDDIEIINVTHHMGFKEDNVADISDEMIKKLEDVGIKTYIGAHAFSGARGVTNKYGGFSPLDVVADTLRMFSHGVKVSAEISIMAADAGVVPVGEKIIAIGGRGHGVDTAVILTPVNAKNLFDLKFHEIIAMPKD